MSHESSDSFREFQKNIYLPQRIRRGERIKTARKYANLTQKQLAEKLGLATGTIQQYELGKRQPRLEVYDRMSDVLNVDFNWLMNGQTLEEYEQEMKDYVARRYEEANIWKEGKDRINAAFDSLNTSGQQEAVKRVEELTEIPRYQAQPPAEAPPASPKDTDTPTA